MVRATTTKNDCLAYVHPAQSRYLCNRVSWQWRQPHITEKDHHIWLLAAKYPHAAKTEAKEDPKNKNHKRAHRQMTSRKPPGNRCTVKMRQRGKSIRNKCEYRKRHTQIYRWNGRTEQEKKKTEHHELNSVYDYYFNQKLKRKEIRMNPRILVCGCCCCLIKPREKKIYVSRNFLSLSFSFSLCPI